MTIELTLRVARGQAAQQAALDAWLDARRARGDQRAAAVVAEGALLPLAAPPDVVIEQIAAGCVCCVGSVMLRVTLTRLLRRARPAALLLLIAAGEHESRVRALLRNGELGIDFEETSPP